MNKSEREYYEKFSKKNINNEELKKAKNKASYLGKLSDDFLTLIAIIKDSMSREYKIPPAKLAMIIGTVLYVVSPIDAVPDIIPIAGYVDDASVVAFVIKNLNDLLIDYRRFKRR